MKNKLKILRKMLFALPLQEANFKIRNFEEGELAQNRLEHVAKVVVAGYNIALETGYDEDLMIHQKSVSNELCGFFSEGIGMGLYTVDLFSLSNKGQFWSFVESEGKNHRYMAYIGAGIACGVFKKRSLDKFLKRASPTSGLLILNGIGFYYAYFKPELTILKGYIPNKFKNDPFYIECYDNGIGRALWFFNGGNPEKIYHTITKFPEERQGAIWAGIGLAATYAGGVPEHQIIKLKQLANSFSNRLGEGSILASHTRDVAGNPHNSESTEIILTNRSAIDCQSFANEINEWLDNRRMIDGKHSLQVFFEKLRDWVSDNSKEVSSLNSKIYQ
jgi:hypothetical protein